MSTALSTWLGKGEIRDRISKALGKAFDADFFLEQILIAMNAPNLAGCSEESKFKATHVCAALGMLPSMQHVALIPRKNKGIDEVTVMPQWQGLSALMLRHPEVKRISHSLVHPTDDFEFDGTTQSVTLHQYDPFDDRRQFKAMSDVRGGYLTVHFRDARPPIYHMVSAATIAKARKCAQADNIWTNWFEEQCIKTLYRNGFARRVVPIDPMINQMQLQAAIQQEDAVLGNDPERVTETAPAQITQITSKPASRTAAIAQQVAAVEPDPEPVADVSEVVSVVEQITDQIQSAGSVEDLEAAMAEIQMSASQMSKAETDRLLKLIDQTAKDLTAAAK